MDASRWKEIRALFDELVEVTPPERAERLAAIGTVDPALRESLASLIAADSRSSGGLGLPELRRTSFAPDDLPPDPFALTARTLSHFRVLEPLGAGGMGVVYRAEDTRLGRTVALKVPLPQYALDPSTRDRFLREARSAAALDHPNLCNVHEVGESEDGRLFLAMTLYPGETLKERLAREGPLPVEAAVDIARQVARGLTCAHEAGIVHRDLKPANLMLLPDGTVKILDFGLAKVRDLTATDAGRRMGTAAYMAPEQILGKESDERADLWALGVVLYEMLTGRRPFSGDHELSIARAIVQDEPVRPSALRDEVTEWAEDVVLSLLEKDPRRRLASAIQALDALGAAPGSDERRGGRASIWWRRLRRNAAVPRSPAGGALLSIVAVIAVSVIIDLGLSALGDSPDRADAHERVARRSTGNEQAYNFFMQGREYHERVRGAAVGGSALGEAEIRAAEALYRRALDLDPSFALAHAHLAQVHGELFFFGFDPSPARREQLREEAEAALRLQPDLPEAHLAMGYYWYIGARDFSRALAEFEIASEGLPNNSLVLIMIANVHRRHGRWTEAIAGYERALRLDPGHSDNAANLARTYQAVRRYADAARAWDQAIATDPDNYGYTLRKARVFLHWRGDLDSLAAALRRIPPGYDPRGSTTIAWIDLALLGRRPGDALPAISDIRSELLAGDDLSAGRLRIELARLHEALGDTAVARAEYETSRSILQRLRAEQPYHPGIAASLGLVHAALGQKEASIRETRRALEQVPLSEDAWTGPSLLYQGAENYARLGETGAAVDLLGQLLAMPNELLTVQMLRLDPRWNPLRRDPRFLRLLAPTRADRGAPHASR
jgi:serine/threonine-protein kinase